MSIKKYKSGYIIMKALPPHNGHLFLIDTALSHSDKVTVLVGSLPSEPIPGELRYNWLKEIYKNNSKISVKWCNEILPQYPEESPAFWNIWVDVVKRYCPSDIDVIFTSELYGEPYAKYLGIKHHLVDLERKVVPISATRIRENSSKNWKFIPDIVKPYFIKRIAIMGPESTGKTTLSNNLSRHYNTECVEEYARTVYEENGNKVSIEDFVKISDGRQIIEDIKIKSCNKILFCDTEDITTYYLSKEYYPNEWEINKEYFENKLSHSKKYNLYILLKPDCEAVQDGTRVFLDKRYHHYQIIKSTLLDRSCNFVEIGGSWDNRFEQSINEINKL